MRLLDAFDKGSLTREYFAAGKIVNLWDIMLEFAAQDFISLCELLVSVGVSLTILRKSGKLNTKTSPALFARARAVLGFLKQLHPTLVAMNLTISADAAARILAYLQSQNKAADWDRLSFETGYLINVVKDELRNRIMMMIPVDQLQFYRKEGTFFGIEIIDQFQWLTEDADEAGNCFALGRYTACVFHLMRVMERCVQWLATRLGISEEFAYDAEWQIIINKIRGRLADLYPRHKDLMRIRYEVTLGHLETVKITWRNPTMHPKATYTEEQARDVLDAVRVFVRDFSTLP